MAFGLLVALVAVATIAATNTVGRELSYMLSNTANYLSTAPPVEPTAPPP